MHLDTNPDLAILCAQIVYRAERRAREFVVVPDRSKYRPVSTTELQRMQYLEAILERAESARHVPT